MELSRTDMLQLLVRLTIAGAISYYTIKVVVNAIDPTYTQKKIAAKKARDLLQKLGVRKDTRLTEYEHMIATQLVLNNQLNTSWKDVAGLQGIIKELRRTVILPITQSRIYTSALIKPPKGVLLHGPPGCGKTLLARAVAREAGCRFINLDVASLTDKWYGESQKLASAVFSLATKIQPCIIFIDEVDSFLRIRATGDHEATAMMKAQFLQHWDGLNTDPNTQVIVMAATNRPRDVDRAILRRLPAAFYIKLPGSVEREAILRLILKEEDLSPELDLLVVASQTDNFSGSDLRELCRNAALYRLNSLLDDSDEESVFEPCVETQDSSIAEQQTPERLRPITGDDFSQAFVKMRASRVLDQSAAALMSIDS